MSLLLGAVFIGLAVGLGLAEQWREWLRLGRMAREVKEVSRDEAQVQP